MSTSAPPYKAPFASAAVLDVGALRAHLKRCDGCRSRLFRLQCMAEAVHRFVAPRFVTTLAIAAVGFAIVSTLL